MHIPVKEKAVNMISQYINHRATDEESIIEELKNLNPDVIIVACGQILPESILNIPNMDVSMFMDHSFPKYRGAAPIQWAVLGWRRKTGITAMYMEKD